MKASCGKCQATILTATMIEDGVHVAECKACGGTGGVPLGFFMSQDCQECDGNGWLLLCRECPA